MRLADHSVSHKALPVNALMGLEQTTRFTDGHGVQNRMVRQQYSTLKACQQREETFFYKVR